MKKLLLLLVFSISLGAQSFIPVASLPTCSVIGASYLLTTATAGLNAYVCPAASGSPVLIPSSLTGSSLASTSAATAGTFSLQVAHVWYDFATDGGGTGLITPANNFTFPAKTIIYGGLINWTTAGAGATNTTSIGITGTGGGAAVFLAATPVASLTSNVLLPSLVTLAAPLKITTTGTITVTTALAALTAGHCEMWFLYVVSPN
jgi:hypothetical protein